ncbi:hypothetical protein J4E80_007917 [Alternaria sp. BMP 0032]|nr:hypothetical protein J4E80_007917 [Alternaria sp. BMP 0032]
MAVHADYPGLTVEIYVDGKPLEEYKSAEDVDASRTATRYVKCRSGAEFAIKTKFNAPFAPMDLKIDVSLDGSLVNSRMVHKHQIFAKPHSQYRATRKEGAKLAPATAGVVKTPTEYKCTYAAALVKFQFKYRSNAELRSLGMILRSPSPPPTPALEFIKKEETPEPVPNLLSKTVSPSATPQSKAASTTPAPPESVSPTPNEHDGLTDEDITVLIKHYRGNDRGLAGQNRKHLLLLLKHYVNKDNESVPVKQEAVSSESRVRIKREHTDDGAARGQGKKRKPEVIVLDD